MSRANRWRRAEGDAERAAAYDYRRIGVGLAVVGVIAAVAAYLSPESQSRAVLLVLAGIGVYGGLLLFWLRTGTTGARPTDRVYDAHASTLAALAADRDLRDTRIYAPVDADADAELAEHLDEADGSFAPVRLFLPAESDDGLPPQSALRPIFADGDAYDGAVVYPTGAALWEAFDEMTTADSSPSPTDLAGHLAEGAVGGFDLADGVDVEVNLDDGSVTATVTGARYGSLTRPDHPIPSFLAVGLAVGLDRPVEVAARGDARFDCRFHWES